MSEKRFRVQEHCLRSSHGIEAENWLVTNDNHSVVLNDKAESHMVANMCNDVIDVLNEQNETITKQQKIITELEKLQSKTAKQQMKFFNGLMESEDEIEDLKKQKQQLYRTESKLRVRIKGLEEKNEQLKSQLYCDDEEGVCNICKYHYLVKDDETELGYYNSRCKKGHCDCARVSLKYCEDFEKELM